MENKTFWSLVLSFVFGTALRWPMPLRIITAGLSLLVLAGCLRRLYSAYGKGVR